MRGRPPRRVHAASARRGADGRDARRGGDGRPPGRRGRVRGALRVRLHPGGHQAAVLHRRRPAPRAHGRPPAHEVRRRNGGRGARAVAGDGPSVGSPEEGAAAAARPAGRHRLRHDPGGRVQGLLRPDPRRPQARVPDREPERASEPRARGHLRGGPRALRPDPLPPRPRAGLRPRRRRRRDGDPRARRPGGRPRLPHRRGGDRGGRADAERRRRRARAFEPPRSGRAPGRRSARFFVSRPVAVLRAPSVRGAPRGDAGGGVPPRGAGLPQNRRRVERRGDVGDDRGRGVRRGLPVREAARVRRGARRRVFGDDGDE